MPRDPSRHSANHKSANHKKAARNKVSDNQSAVAAKPFDTIEDAWFWFIQAQQAKIDGARISAGAGAILRPCEPLDILQALDHIYRARKVTMEQLLTLRHYGRMRMAPDPKRPSERKSYFQWCEALSELSVVLIEKKILKPQGFLAPWLNSANIVSIESFREAAE